MAGPQVDLQMEFETPSEVNITLSAQALDYIKKQGGILTLEEAPQTGCCTNIVFVGAHLGKSREEGYFGVKEQDGVQIYYDPFIITKDKRYEVVLEGFWKWKTLRVY